MEKLSLLPAKVRLSAPDWYLHPFVQEGEVAAHLDTGLGFLGWRHAMFMLQYWGPGIFSIPLIF